MISNKIYKLARRLFQMTQEEKLEWRETAREGVYQLIVDDYVVRMAEVPGEDAKDVPGYVLEVCNAKGTVLEQITAADFNDRMHDSMEFMQDLYLRVRRVALGTETALDHILERLEEDGPKE